MFKIKNCITFECEPPTTIASNVFSDDAKKAIKERYPNSLVYDNAVVFDRALSQDEAEEVSKFISNLL